MLLFATFVFRVKGAEIERGTVDSVLVRRRSRSHASSTSESDRGETDLVEHGVPDLAVSSVHLMGVDLHIEYNENA